MLPTLTQRLADVARQSASSLQLPPQAWAPLLVVLSGWLVMFTPSYVGLSQTIWASDEQGHGPIILAVSFWLLWRRRAAFAALQREPSMVLALPLLALGIAAYALGRSQVIWTLEIGAQLLVLAALVLAFFGWRAWRVAAFPLFFMIFMIPWPGDWVAAVTTPLKSAVSLVAAEVLHAVGYPIARSGVILSVGPYQMLVADACAGLNSMFTLEALGLLYMNLMGYTTVARNVTLAVLILPIAFIANVARVIILVLVTYHFGDAAGQGFAHDFAGLVLFLVALVLIMATDRVLDLFFGRQRVAARSTP